MPGVPTSLRKWTGNRTTPLARGTFAAAFALHELKDPPSHFEAGAPETSEAGDGRRDVGATEGAGMSGLCLL
jgi:hypothetical protein